MKSGQKNLDATGVGACACARHGCFVPHTMVDFQKGEKYVHGVVKSVFADIYPTHRQMNMDYSITQAAKYRTGSSLHWLNILLIYDIVCQWVKYFLQRVQLCNTLEVLEHQEWLVAIGKFHLAVHVKPCFWRHSLNFMKGVGEVDGEIMETLWNPFNPFGMMMRSMGAVQQKEILDDHMRDTNFKKLVGMGWYFHTLCINHFSYLYCCCSQFAC
jgi:hypothetical protein